MLLRAVQRSGLPQRVFAFPRLNVTSGSSTPSLHSALCIAGFGAGAVAMLMAEPTAVRCAEPPNGADALQCVLDYRRADRRAEMTITELRGGAVVIATEVIVKVTGPVDVFSFTQDGQTTTKLSAGLSVTADDIEIGLNVNVHEESQLHIKLKGMSFGTDGYLSYWESQTVLPNGVSVRTGIPPDALSALVHDLRKLFGHSGNTTVMQSELRALLQRHSTSIVSSNSC